MTWITSAVAQQIAEECQQAALRHIEGRPGFTGPACHIDRSPDGLLVLNVQIVIRPADAPTPGV